MTRRRAGTIGDTRPPPFLFAAQAVSGWPRSVGISAAPRHSSPSRERGEGVGPGAEFSSACPGVAARSIACPPPVAASEAEVLLPVGVRQVVLAGSEMIADGAADRVVRFRQLRHAEASGVEQAVNRFRMHRG